MTHLKVEWVQHNEELPVMIYIELDDDRFEMRKVEVFHDGRADYADMNRKFGKTELGYVAVPSAQEIGLDPQFIPNEISASEFERVWLHAIKAN